MTARHEAPERLILFEDRPSESPFIERVWQCILLVCTLVYIVPRTAVIGAILLTAYLGGAVATQLRVDAPLLTHTLFGVYLGVLVWGGLWLRDARIRALAPVRSS